VLDQRRAVIGRLAEATTLTRDQVAAAAAALSLSPSQCYRLLQAYRRDPEGGLGPRRRGRPPRAEAPRSAEEGCAESQTLETLVALIYEGCLEPQPWLSFLRALRLHVGCDTADISLISARSGGVPLSVWDTRLPLTAADVREAEARQRHLAHLDPMATRPWQPGEALTLDEIATRAELERNPFFLKVMRPFGIEQALSLFFTEPSGWSCLIGLMNGGEGRPFGAPEKALLRRLRPHLERALRLYAGMAAERSEKRVLEDAVARLAIGVITLDLHGRVVHSNPVAQALVRRTRALTVADGQLRAARSEDARRLRQAIQEAAAAPDAGMVAAFQIDDGEGDTLCLLVRPIFPATPLRGESSPRVAVYLSDPAHRYATPDRLIAQLFGLTAAEASLSLALANGATVDEAAAALGLARSTVRSYIKSVFLKTGVRRQAHLVRLILHSVALLG
jgi:DNA-binding CsgD family transcriptional regulator